MSESRSVDDVMAATGASRATVYAARRKAGLGRKAVRHASTTRVRGQARNRHPDVLNRSAYLLAVNHPAIQEARTVYPRAVVDPDDSPLKPGEYNAKVGPRVAKGEWSGFPLFTLTIEERATCPVACSHWRSCYGNRMHWAKRVRHGPELEAALSAQVDHLARQHPKGFAVRLHVLGDFYSPRYVKLWRDLLASGTPRLRILAPLVLR